MRDRVLIVGGLVLFLGLVTLPVWFNVAAGTSSKRPALTLPTEAKSCVAPVEYMRASHMNLLLTWRDDVVRRGDRTFVALDGKTYAKSLTQTCLACHASRAEFCDRCHDYAAVKPTCWECHLESRQVQTAAR